MAGDRPADRGGFIPISPDNNEFAQPFEAPRVLDPMGSLPSLVNPSGNPVRGGAGFPSGGLGGGGRGTSTGSRAGESGGAAARGTGTKANSSRAGGAGDDAGKDADDPNCDAECKKFRRSKSERRKALLRDANDPNSRLTPEQRRFIIENNGNNVPPGMEVSHDIPLYSGLNDADKRALDTMSNMNTIEKSEHRALHVICGDTYHAFPP